ncbi:MAG: hypothetical protein WCL44_02975, partial [bacterium]
MMNAPHDGAAVFSRLSKWQKRSWFARFLSLFAVAQLIVPQVLPMVAMAEEVKAAAPVTAPVVTEAAPAVPAKSDSQVAGPSGFLGLGFELGENESRGMGNALLPLWMSGSGRNLVFCDLRVSAGDNNEEEFNAGLGIRRLVNAKGSNGGLVVGANLYYDSRWTQYDNQVNQLGVGLELLSKWVDARFNYYLPETDKMLAGKSSQSWTETSQKSEYVDTTSASVGSIRATDHQIVQPTTYTTTRLTSIYTTTDSYRNDFEQYESALKGFDFEVGVRVPYIGKYVDTRVFAGYQQFDDPFNSEDSGGVKGRIEIRALPGLTIDAQYFEDKELNGGDYYVGARLYVPFDTRGLVSGKNPFKGAGNNFKITAAKQGLDRMTEPVMRDVKVRTTGQTTTNATVSSATTTTTSSEVISKQRRNNVLLDDVQFVNNEKGRDVSSGRAEDSLDTIQEAIDTAFGKMNVYVFGTSTPYNENPVIADGVKVYGSGVDIVGPDGKKYKATTSPTIKGDGVTATVTMGNNTTLAGFNIQSTAGAGGTDLILSPNDHGVWTGSEWVWDASRAGIKAVNKTGLTIYGNTFGNVSHGAIIVNNNDLPDPTATLTASIFENKFSGTEEIGLVIDTEGDAGKKAIAATPGLVATSSFDVRLVDNDFNSNGLDGLFVDATRYDSASLTVAGGNASGNIDGSGIRIVNVEGLNGVSVLLQDLVADNNHGNGVEVNGGIVAETGDAALALAGIQAVSNTGSGIYLSGELTTITGTATLVLSDINASANGNDGIEFDEFSTWVSGKGDASAVLENVVAQSNDEDGILIGTDEGDDDLFVYANNGNATALFDGVDVSYNGANGIRIEPCCDEAAVHSAEGNASLTFNNVSAISNDDYGIVFEDNGDAGEHWGNAVVYAANGNSTIVFDTVTLSSNGNDGLEAGSTMAHSITGDATALFSNVLADGNGEDGLCIASFAFAENGNAGAQLEGITLTNNHDTGMDVWYDAVVAGGSQRLTGITEAAVGNATFIMRDAVVQNNGYDGLQFESNIAVALTGAASSVLGVGAAHPLASVLFENVDVSFNGRNGISVNGSGAVGGGGADAQFVMDNVTAMSNYATPGSSIVGQGNGIFIRGDAARSIAGNAFAQLTNIKASYNGVLTGTAQPVSALTITDSGNGIYVGGSIASSVVSGNATAILSGIEVTHNGIDRSGITAPATTISSSGNGIYVGEAVASAAYDAGNASAVITDVVASYNGENMGHQSYNASAITITDSGNGIFVGGDVARAGHGSAVALLGEIEASYNGIGMMPSVTEISTTVVNSGNGILVNGSVARSWEYGDAIAMMSDITASGNGNMSWLTWQAPESGGAVGITSTGNGICINGSLAMANSGAAVGLVLGDMELAANGRGLLPQDDDTLAFHMSGNGLAMSSGASAVSGMAVFAIAAIEGMDTLPIDLPFGMPEGVTYGGQFTAEHNMMDGIHIENNGAEVVTGSAIAAFAGNINAHGSISGNGIFIGNNGANAVSGTAAFIMAGLSAEARIPVDGAAEVSVISIDAGLKTSNNELDGIHIGNNAANVSGSGTAIAAIIGDITTEWNNGNGLYIGNSGAAVSDTGNAIFVVGGLNASAWLGVPEIAVSSPDLTITGSVTAAFNGEDGIHIGERGAEVSTGTAVAVFAGGIGAYLNGQHSSEGNGIYIGNDGARVETGTAVFVVGGIDLEGVALGIPISAQATVNVDMNANNGIYIGDNGVQVDGSGTGVTAILGNVSASHNGWGGATDSDNGNGIYFGSNGASVEEGAAVFMMAGCDIAMSGNDVQISADARMNLSQNYGSGLSIKGNAAQVTTGDATAVILGSVNASGNGWSVQGGSGVSIGNNGASATSGNAVFMAAGFSGGFADGVSLEGTPVTMTGSLNLSHNQGAGLMIGGNAAQVYTGYGEAVAVFTDITADSNGYSGISIGGTAAKAGGRANATAVFGAGTVPDSSAMYCPWLDLHLPTEISGTVRASNNGGSGILINGDAASAEVGNATAVFDGVSVQDNDGDGIEISHGFGAVAMTGDATLTMKHIDAISNGYDGIFMSKAAGVTHTGDATALFEDIVTSNNGNDGIELCNGGVAVTVGNASLTFRRVNAMSNDGRGIGIEDGFAAYAMTGNASVTFESVNAMSNGSGIALGSGASAVARAESGTAAVSFEDVDASFNGGDGISTGHSIAAEVNNGAATLTMKGVTAIS